MTPSPGGEYAEKIVFFQWTRRLLSTERKSIVTKVSQYYLFKIILWLMTHSLTTTYIYSAYYMPGKLKTLHVLTGLILKHGSPGYGGVLSVWMGTIDRDKSRVNCSALEPGDVERPGAQGWVQVRLGC
jgi:hypothetical protein